jgi:hypothetical protein
MNLINLFPTIHKIHNVIYCDATLGVDFGNPKVLVNALVNREVFPFGDYENGRCNIFGFPSLKLWRMPKTRNAPIPNSDGGSRVKEVHA